MFVDRMTRAKALSASRGTQARRAGCPPTARTGQVAAVPDAPLSRRDVMLGAAAFAALPAPRPAERTDAPKLRELAAARGITYGAAPFAYPPSITPDMEALVVDQCAVIVPVMNWKLVEPRRGAYDFRGDRGVAAFARRLGRPMTGVPLLWPDVLPAWFAGLSDRAAKEAAVVDFIGAVGRRYAGQFWSVYVVNEALESGDGLDRGRRWNALSNAFGDAYWDLAFRAARQAFPGTLLMYNENRLEQDFGNMESKRRALLQRLDALRKDGTPIDAVGLQSHLELERPFDAASFARFLGEVAARGVAIILSELDVLDVGAPSNIEARDRAVASMYRRFLDVALAEPAVCGVVTWGLSDRTTWLTGRTSPRFARRDGLPTRPLPFDADLRPKPAFAAIAEAFRAAPQRDSRWRPIGAPSP